MTEIEAVEKLKNMRLFMQIEDENNDCKFTEDDYKANEMAINALEKHIPKKPMFNGNNWYRCVNGCEIHKKQFEKDWYCPNCGQKLDWSDEE